MPSGGLEDREHDREHQKRRHRPGEEEERRLQDGPKPVELPLRFLGKDIACVPEKPGKLPAFHAHPAELAHQGKSEAPFSQGFIKGLPRLQLPDDLGQGGCGGPVMEHLPHIPERFRKGPSALQEGGEGGAEADEEDPMVKSPMVQE